jgi:hypothetical protein
MTRGKMIAPYIVAILLLNMMWEISWLAAATSYIRHTVCSFVGTNSNFLSMHACTHATVTIRFSCL